MFGHGNPPERYLVSVCYNGRWLASNDNQQEDNDRGFLLRCQAILAASHGRGDRQIGYVDWHGFEGEKE